MFLKFNLVSETSIFNQPNAMYGLFYFIAIISYNFLTFIPYREHLLLFFSGVSVLFCFVLAYLVVFIIKSLCLVCCVSYVLNGMTFYYGYDEFQ